MGKQKINILSTHAELKQNQSNLFAFRIILFDSKMITANQFITQK